MSQPHVPFRPAKGTGRKLVVFFHGFTGYPHFVLDEPDVIAEL